MTARGWASALAYGIRTVIDLRNEDEYAIDQTPAPAEITRLRIPLDQRQDREFWTYWESGPQFGTPLYYGAHLDRFPSVNAAVITAIARATPGGVVFHCAAGRDRTGQVAMLVLAILGASPEEIGAEYVQSYGRSADGHDALVRGYLEERGTTAEAELARVLGERDVLSVLRAGGATERDFDALRARALNGAPPCLGSPG